MSVELDRVLKKKIESVIVIELHKDELMGWWTY